MIKWLRRLAGGALALLLSILAATWLFGLQRHADAAPEARALARSDGDVIVTEGRELTLRSTRRREQLGLIVYPGAYVDPRGYLPTLRPIAAAGYRVIIVPMPLEVAMLGYRRALGVQRDHPDIRHWVLLGHSLGGAMAGLFASGHADALAGVIIWDSFPAGSLADFPKPVWHLHRARPDGSPPASFAARRHLFPRHSVWVPIPGGIHMYFGAFSGGGYREDWAPLISQAEQHRLVVMHTLRALRAVQGSATQAAAVHGP